MMRREQITPVVLAGGTGTRLWPVSRKAMPKQFLPLVGERSTFQDALLRVADPDLFAPVVVITNEQHRFHVLSQAKAVGIEAAILLEPAVRDSGPAIAAAAEFVARRDGDDRVVLTLAADHVILDDDLFRATARTGRAAARAGRIVTFGIRPSEPKTGYGYIRAGALDESGAAPVAQFAEKPDAATAARYVADGWLWNSGNFMFTPGTLRAELALYAPNVTAAVGEAVAEAVVDLAFHRLDTAAFERAPRISFDYCVMEQTRRASVVAADYRWSDIGDWGALWEFSDKDGEGNAVTGRAELVDTRDCVIMAEKGLVGTIGVGSLVVAATGDAVLVADRTRSADIKGLVARLEAAGRREAGEHPLVRRPWGSYECVDEGERYKVKRIAVEPGAALSLQRHVHRAEHWIVVRGVAEVTIGDETRMLHENESTYIPPGTIHRLGNPGLITLELIEVQSGAYLGEDDIERLDDAFGRS